MAAGTSARSEHAPIILLSPHLDDAVFSCGGLIAKSVRERRRVTVVTFFTGTPQVDQVPASLRRFCDYRERKEEDRRAIALLGAEGEWLDLVERAFRAPPLTGLVSVFREPPQGRGVNGASSISQVVEQHITALLDRDPQAMLGAPLAVGNHVDHVELFVASVRVMLERNARDRFFFYEDAYALGTRARRQHFVTRQLAWPRRLAPQRASVRARAMFAVLGLARAGPPVEHYLPADAARLAWTCQPTPIADDEGQKLQAVVQYASQVSMLGGDRAWCELLRRYHRCFGPQVAEPTWRATSSEL